MKIVLDTNVVMDVLADREPFANDSEEVMNLAANRRVVAAITANSITDIAYLLRDRPKGGKTVRAVILDLMEVLEVLAVGREQCVRATELPMADYENALLAVCAKRWNADLIVTRNIRDFKESPVQAVSPRDCLRRIGRM